MDLSSRIKQKNARKRARLVNTRTDALPSPFSSPQDTEVCTWCHRRAADPYLPVPRNSSKSSGGVKSGTVAGEMVLPVAAQRGDNSSSDCSSTA